MPSASRAFVTRVREELAVRADPVRAPRMQAYMKSAMPYRGVPLPEVRRVCRSVVTAVPLEDEETWQGVVTALWDDASFREERYAATALARHRRFAEHRQPHTLGLYRHLVVTGAWWDHVDEVATHLVRDLLDRYPDVVTPEVLTWRTEDDPWLRRSAIICQVGRKDAVDRDLLVAAVDANLEDSAFGRDFFIRKAIGWALRDHARTDPDWVRGFVSDRAPHLSGLSRREALKHLG